MSNFKLIRAVYLLLIVFLFLYSFTQVDLGLTLTKLSIWQVFQNKLQYIGYFQRPLSTVLFLLILLLLSIFYILFLNLAKKFSIRYVWTLVLGTTILLVLSYNAFSHDLFNYIFDAKIVTYYHQNPYEHKALDYLGEPMLAFMHWTHRTYPYGPIWLALTVPLSFLGAQFFLPTFFIFKLFTGASFLGSIYFIKKISDTVFRSQSLQNIIFFALNPLILIESLVSGHNDMVMMFFALASVYFLISRKYMFALILLGLSIGIKFATVFLVPIFVGIWFLREYKKRSINWVLAFFAMASVMIVPVVFSATRTEIQPWYLLWILPFIALITHVRWLLVLSIVFSIGILFQYSLFLYTGNWDPPIPAIKYWITVALIAFSFATILFTWYKHKKLL